MADGLVRSNFDEASYPSGVLETPGNLSEDRARDLSDKFVERMRGSRRPAVLSGGVTYQALTHNARDQQWIEARQWGAAEIARLFGLPPAALHIPVVGGSQVTYNNAVSVRTDILHLGLTPIISRLESAWSSLLPSTQQAHIDTTNYLPPLEAITPSAADPNAPPTDTANTPTPDQEADPDAGNTAVV
jgi:phage portal protein BeeE